MAQPKGKMKIVIYAEIGGRQTMERLAEVVYKALNECERIIPVAESVRVKETQLSKVQYACWRQKRISRARLSKWSGKDWRGIMLYVARIVAIFAAPAIAAIVTYLLNKG